MYINKRNSDKHIYSNVVIISKQANSLVLRPLCLYMLSNQKYIHKYNILRKSEVGKLSSLNVPNPRII